MAKDKCNKHSGLPHYQS